MDDRIYVFGTAAMIVGLFLARWLRGKFDPFEPVWLFFVGYGQIYVVQALSYREWAIGVRGEAIVSAANLRALWALAWFLAVYLSPIGGAVARKLPRAPRSWSAPLVVATSPLMVAYGLVCSGLVLYVGAFSGGEGRMSAEENLFRQFPIFMLVAGAMLIVTGNVPERRRPAMVAAGVLVCLAYVVIWMFNGKRSHSLIGLLTGACAFYASRRKRPSMATLAGLAFVGALVVSLSIGWRGNYRYEQDASGFVRYLSEFRLESILVNLNMKEAAEVEEGRGLAKTHETEEIGGFLLMLSTVPEASDYDYGSVYNRVWSTYIPRLFWEDKPYYGRDEWLAAWKAGSEQAREEGFTGPSVGILGAAQLNGGAAATVVVLGVLAVMLRSSYEYYRLYQATPWAQAWWSLTFYNAWLMTVNDNPMVWFYYIYGHTTLPPLVAFFAINRLGDARRAARGET